MTVITSRETFGSLPDGTPVSRYILANKYLTIAVLDYGIRLQSLLLTTGQGVQRETVLGFDSVDAYVREKNYMGAVVGRFANRIRDARFEIDGKICQLDANEGNNHLHGGLIGFHNRCWETRQEPGRLIFHLTSPHGEGGYPGNLKTTVTLHLEDNRLVYTFDATTDRPTHVNFTNHAFFNLLGSRGTVLAHKLRINADSYLPVDQGLLPVGELKAVDGTPFDFRENRAIKSGGWDLCYALNQNEKPAAVLSSPDDQIQLIIDTSEPGMQFYTGNFLKEKYTGLCLETQHFPDSPNIPGFPSTLLRPGQNFFSETSYELRTTQ